jgi:hypothetical protein
MRRPNGFGPALVTLSVSVAIAAATAAVRRSSLRWGATREELRGPLPGDELIARADLQSTRGISIRTVPAEVWPWIAQLGQGRGGFYSYDALENLLGYDLHSADTVVARWQRVEVGDQVRLAPEVALRVARVDPGRALVLSGGIPLGPLPAPYDFTWAFVLVPGADGSTRLVVRERYAYHRWWAGLVVEPVEFVSFAMSARMLRGIKRRAETPPAPPVTGNPLANDPPEGLPWPGPIGSARPARP